DVACCFEAGRDGFWLHRVLTAHGIAAYVLEPTSVLVSRRARRAKTAPLQEEDAKRPHREREHLVQEKLRVENRIEGLLFTQGIRKRPSLRSWEREMAVLRTGDGREIPRHPTAELDSLR